MQAFYDGLTLIGSLVVMALVIGLTYYGSRWYAGRMSKSASGRHIKILDRVTVSPGCALAIVQAGDQFYLVGLSDKNIQLLCKLEDYIPEAADNAPVRDPFGELFQSLLQKTKGKDNPKNDGGEL